MQSLLTRCADAFLLRIGEKAAGTGVHRGDEHHTGRIVDRAQGAGDRDIAVFQRLPHDLEHIAPELGQLVQEKDPVTASVHNRLEASFNSILTVLR